jgi:hypothetical protein
VCIIYQCFDVDTSYEFWLELITLADSSEMCENFQFVNGMILPVSAKKGKKSFRFFNHVKVQKDVVLVGRWN